jgi:hypothetical protein
MPEPVLTPPSSTEPPPPDSTAQPGTPSASAAPASTWRAGASSPAWARGKTAEEILGLAGPIVDSLMRGDLVDRSAAQPPTREPEPPALADDEYLTYGQFRQLAASQRDTSALDLAAETAQALVEARHPAEFAKYGEEIRGMIRQVPGNLRTIANLEQVVRMVRGNHIDEIAAERAQQLVNAMPATLRSGGGASPGAPVDRSASLESEKIPAEWKQRAQRNGVDENIVAEFCRANDMTVAAFYKQFDTPRNPIVAEISTKRS